MTVPGSATGQPARFRAVIGADQQSFALRRRLGLVALILAIAIIACDLVTVLLVVAGISLIVPGRSQDLPLGIVVLMCGLLLLWVVFVVQFRRPVVSVTLSELRARGAFGVTRRAQWSEITRIDLRPKYYGRAVMAVRVPYARKAGGGGLWLDALAGDWQRRPADPAQLEVLRQLRAMLNVPSVTRRAAGEGAPTRLPGRRPGIAQWLLRRGLGASPFGERPRT